MAALSSIASSAAAASPLAPADRPARSRAAAPGLAGRGDVIAAADEIGARPAAHARGGGRVVRGGVIRGVGFGVSTALGLATAVLLLRHLGVDDFGRYATVMALLGIVAGITDAGLTAVGSREISVARTASSARSSSTTCSCSGWSAASLGVLAAVAFTVVRRLRGRGRRRHGCSAASGVVLISAQSMLTVPIWVELRIVSLTALEVLRNLLTLAGVAVLVLAGAGLLAVLRHPDRRRGRPDPGHALLARVGVRFARGVRRDRRSCRSLRETLPLAVAFAMSVIYFRVLVVLVSLLSTDVQTGLFGTSFRIFEMLLGLPVLDPLGRPAAALGRRRRGRRPAAPVLSRA